MVILSWKEEAEAPIYIETLISDARNTQGVPNGKLPGALKAKTVKSLASQGNCGKLAIDNGASLSVLRTDGMYSCAAVIYFSKQKAAAWVYHANGGDVSSKSVERALTELGKPNAADLLVVYARPGWEEDYRFATKALIDVGITENNILIIHRLTSGCGFGIDNSGRVGL